LKKRVLFIGASGAGKTTLIRVLEGGGEALKTQTITVKKNIIDIPGEYIEIRRMNFAVINVALEASAIFVVQDSTSEKPTIPPNFCEMFRIPVFGVITKLDHPASNLERAKKLLLISGVKGDYLMVSGKTGYGMERLKELYMKFI
jgi:ethanolamine utilization protein EutP